LDLSEIQGSINKRQARPLTDEDQDVEWAGPITIGTPGQSFLIDFDSASILSSITYFTNALAASAGSSDLWVPSSNCTSLGCSSKNMYNSSSSSTSNEESGTFSIQYIDGSAVSGPIYTDAGMFICTSKTCYRVIIKFSSHRCRDHR
jgi:cathepsin D